MVKMLFMYRLWGFNYINSFYDYYYIKCKVKIIDRYVEEYF